MESLYQLVSTEDLASHQYGVKDLLAINFQVFQYQKDACVLLATRDSTHIPELPIVFAILFLPQ